MNTSAAVDRDRLRRVVEATLPIARARAQLLGEIRDAFERGDEAAALAGARRLCGLPSPDTAP